MAKTYTVRKEVFIDYAHHIAGHPGACMNIHGHTWCWQASLQAEELNEMGMVMDFSEIKKCILSPVHELFDHALALSYDEYLETCPEFERIGQLFGAAKVCDVAGHSTPQFHGAILHHAGGMKIVTLPFVPTCETLTDWFYDYVEDNLLFLGFSPRIKVASVCIYEQMHPTTSCCTVTSN